MSKNNMAYRILKNLNNPIAYSYVVNQTGLLNFLPDEAYIKIVYRVLMGHPLNLDNPKTFCEKINWLKLYDRKPEYTIMVDKCLVKEYVEKRIGKQYIVPTLGSWASFAEIDFNLLPEKFVLKCNHDSGGLIICKGKNKLDMKYARKKLSKCLKRNFYYVGREWPYKEVKPMIFAEQLLENKDGSELRDYKFYCFNGEPRFLYVSESLTDHSKARVSYLNLDWTFSEFYRKDYKQYETIPEKPETFNDMIRFARVLSEGIPFLRVDFYESDKKLFFGELTFSPGSGLTTFYPEKWEKYWGEQIDTEVLKNYREI